MCQQDLLFIATVALEQNCALDNFRSYSVRCAALLGTVRADSASRSSQRVALIVNRGTCVAALAG